MTTIEYNLEMRRIYAEIKKHGAEPGEMTHSLKQAILRWVADEVIGENETGAITDPNSVNYGESYSNVYVDRDEQRKILAQHGYKGGE